MTKQQSLTKQQLVSNIAGRVSRQQQVVCYNILQNVRSFIYIFNLRINRDKVCSTTQKISTYFDQNFHFQRMSTCFLAYRILTGHWTANWILAGFPRYIQTLRIFKTSCLSISMQWKLTCITQIWSYLMERKTLPFVWFYYASYEAVKSD